MANSKFDTVRNRFYDIEQWLNQGLNEAQIIKNLGISKTTWESYKKKHSELSELLKKGKENQVTEVENSLYKNATGYYYYIDELVKVKDPDGGEHVEKISVKKFKGPETAAAIFFLKNKDKKHWADNPQLIDLRREEFEHRKKTDEEFGSW